MKEKFQNIKWTSPRYILPILLVLVAFFVNWAVLTFGGGDKQDEYVGEEVDALNPSMPDPSVNITETNSTKFDAFKENFKDSQDYSAIQVIEEDIKTENGGSSVYTEEEQMFFDSIAEAKRRGNQSSIVSEKITRIQEIRNRTRGNSQPDNYYEDRYNEINNRTVTTTEKVSKTEDKVKSENEAFIERMKIIDSITNPEKYAKVDDIDIEKKVEDVAEKAMYLSKTKGGTRDFFNTINANDKRKDDIKAIIDEGVTVIEGSRVKIRLLSDVYLDDMLLQKGSYVYGVVSGFKTQRLIVNIHSIKIRDKFFPVKLAVYDNDGMKGLYVPQSKFREMTKTLAGQLGQSGGQTLRLEESANSGSEVLYSFINDVVQASTKSASGFLKSNKAKVKYNTVVYLINENQN